MEIIVMNQSSIEEYAKESHEWQSVAISIASERQPSADIVPCDNNNIKDVLFLKFDDVDSSTGGIGKDDAKKIKEFFLKYAEEDINLFIVQCEAGQSRSAGIAGALMKYIWNDDTAIFDNPRYTPNMLCYRTILNELMEE